jgi:hypothetical protein
MTHGAEPTGWLGWKSILSHRSLVSIADDLELVVPDELGEAGAEDDIA